MITVAIALLPSLQSFCPFQNTSTILFFFKELELQWRYRVSRSTMASAKKSGTLLTSKDIANMDQSGLTFDYIQEFSGGRRCAVHHQPD